MRYRITVLFVLLSLISLKVAHGQSYPRVRFDDAYSVGNEEAQEPTVAVWPDGTGNKLVAACINFLDETPKVYVSSSTNLGVSWQQWGSAPNPSAATGSLTDAAPHGDPKIIGRSYNSAPEVVLAYRMSVYQGTNADEGLFVNFSSDMGNHWAYGLGQVPYIEQNAAPHTVNTLRPSIATDGNYAFVAYTHGSGLQMGAEAFCQVIQPNSHTIDHTNDLHSIAQSTSSYYVTACGVSVASNGNVYVLWRKEYTSGTFDLLVSKSTDHGSTWPSVTSIVTGINIPVNLGAPDYKRLSYLDYAAMTISPAGCDNSDEMMYIAYTELPSTGDNPSELILASCVLTNIATTNQWHSETIDPNNGYVQPLTSSCPGTAYIFKSEPELSPDGFGGAFLLYHTAQAGTSSCRYPAPVAVLYETGNRGPAKVLSNLAELAGVDLEPPYEKDYCGITWDPVQKLAHPVWTDWDNSYFSNYGVFTQSIAPYPKASMQSNQDLGYLGYSNQRRVVTIGNTAYTATYGPLGTVSTNAIWITQRTGDANPTTPFRLDPAAPQDLNEPCIAVYERGGTSNQKAIAVAWTDASNNLWVDVKEMDDCPDNQPWRMHTFTCSIPQVLIPANARVVITPLTTPISGSPNERYLLGWVLAYIDYKRLNITSFTLLRGGQSTSQALTNNGWATATQDANFTWVGPTWLYGHDFYPDYTNGFISVTSDESNGTGFNPSKTDDESMQFAVTANGSQRGLWMTNEACNTSGAHLGEYIDNSLTSPIVLMDRYVSFSVDRNPSITINSKGQKLVAWENVNGPWDDDSRGVLYYSSEIRLAKTQYGGKWNPVEDIISASISTPTFSGLLNPSITAFPKTTLLNASDETDQDPAAVELLFTSNGDHRLHERQFIEPKSSSFNTWNGQWSKSDPKDPMKILRWGPYNGTNSQRSFGYYNAGPRYKSTPGQAPDLNLYRDGTYAPDRYYFHGLTFGFGNEVNGTGVVQKTHGTNVAGSSLADIAYKLGTFDTALDVQLYRIESRFKDSSMVSFRWGKVYVEDTTLTSPIREIMLRDGSPDSNGYPSNSAIRDSIFATEWFDWPVSAQIRYDRFLSSPVGGTYSMSIDTIVKHDSNGDPIYIYDTGTVFHPDSMLPTATSFIGSSIRMKYTVELVHSNSTIDTVETMIYKPFGNLFIKPRTVHLAHVGTSPDTVMLRVRGDFMGIPDADTNARFFRESKFDSYPMSGDTTIAIGTGGGIVMPDSCFQAIGPYPNPSDHGAQNVSILVHYCSSGSTITAGVYNSVGTQIGSNVSMTSDGQTWDRLQVPAPSSAGTYHIQVTVGGSSITVGYSVN